LGALLRRANASEPTLTCYCRRRGGDRFDVHTVLSVKGNDELSARSELVSDAERADNNSWLVRSANLPVLLGLTGGESIASGIRRRRRRADGQMGVGRRPIGDAARPRSGQLQ